MLTSQIRGPRIKYAAAAGAATERKPGQDTQAKYISQCFVQFSFVKLERSIYKSIWLLCLVLSVCVVMGLLLVVIIEEPVSRLLVNSSMFWR